MLSWFLTIKIFGNVCLVAVACGLDDVSNNQLRCADVPGIRLPFSYKFILLIKLIKDRITTIHWFVKEDRHFIVLVNFSQIYNLLFMYRLSRSFYFIIKIIAVWCFNPMVLPRKPGFINSATLGSILRVFYISIVRFIYCRCFLVVVIIVKLSSQDVFSFIWRVLVDRKKKRLHLSLTVSVLERKRRFVWRKCPFWAVTSQELRK